MEPWEIWRSCAFRCDELRTVDLPRWWLRLCAFLVVGAVSAQSSLHAQEMHDSVKPPVERQIVFEGGSSVGNIHVFAFATDRRIADLGVEYDLHSWGSLLTARVDYVAEVLPTVLLNEPAQYGANSIALTTARQVKYGFGFSPVGVRLLWRRRMRHSGRI